jgi:hypothetical protein
MDEEQRARLTYLREDLAVWEDRRSLARWSLAADKFYNCSAMDHEINAMKEEIRVLSRMEASLQL